MSGFDVEAVGGQELGSLGFGFHFWKYLADQSNRLLQ